MEEQGNSAPSESSRLPLTGTLYSQLDFLASLRRSLGEKEGREQEERKRRIILCDVAMTPVPGMRSLGALSFRVWLSPLGTFLSFLGFFCLNKTSLSPVGLWGLVVYTA